MEEKMKRCVVSLLLVSAEFIFTFSGARADPVFLVSGYVSEIRPFAGTSDSGHNYQYEISIVLNTTGFPGNQEQFSGVTLNTYPESSYTERVMWRTTLNALQNAMISHAPVVLYKDSGNTCSFNSCYISDVNFRVCNDSADCQN
jgi:hypothetical protein